MELFCPHCTKRVTVPDDKAGQVMSCPLCGKQFMAPSLAPAMSTATPPVPPPSPTPMDVTYGLGPAPVTPSSAPPPPPEPPRPAISPEPAPMPPGDYSRTWTGTLSPNWLAFIAPACAILIFFLSFFTWHNDTVRIPDPRVEAVDGRGVDINRRVTLWGLAFSEWNARFIAYTILMLFALPLTLLALLLEKNWVPVPPQFRDLLTLKNLIVSGVLLLAFLMLCIEMLYANFVDRINPDTFVFKVVFRLHLLALLASFAMFWLDYRKKWNLPLPKAEVRW